MADVTTCTSLSLLLANWRFIGNVPLVCLFQQPLAVIIEQSVWSKVRVRRTNRYTRVQRAV
jgi:hypothetical protein